MKRINKDKGKSLLDEIRKIFGPDFPMRIDRKCVHKWGDLEERRELKRFSADRELILLYQKCKICNLIRLVK